MGDRYDDPRLLSLVGPYEWRKHEHVRVIGGPEDGQTGTILNIGDSFLQVTCDIDGEIWRVAREFCEPVHHRTRRREAISMAAYVETVAQMLVTSSEYPEA